MSAAVDDDFYAFVPTMPGRRAVPVRARALSLVPAVPSVPSWPHVAPVAPADAGRVPLRRSTAAPDAVPTVATLFGPSDDCLPMRLTRRGAVVVALAVLAAGIAMVWVAALSAARPAAAPTGQAHVTVRAGDTLWSIAGRVAPGTDPRAEIATLRRLNGIGGTQLTPGERLQVR